MRADEIRPQGTLIGLCPEVQEDPSDLGGIGDDGKHLHGEAAAAQGIDFVHFD